MATPRNDIFVANIDRWIGKAKGRMDTVVRKVTFDLFASVLRLTPRDTGRLVGNWQFAVDKIPQGILEATMTSQGAMDGLLMQMGNLKAGHIYYLVNNLPYAPIVEYGLYPNPPKQGSHMRGDPPGPHIHTAGGYSLKAPYGMVRITLLRFGEFVQKAASAQP